MTPWQLVNKVTEQADTLKKLEDLYMERGNVTRDEARIWAKEQWERYSHEPLIKPDYNTLL